ncbi:MAG: NAD(P)/FAD-dependent oxidoreductase [Deltaproteobacteria bacterium]|nr:NAD(P)/FAD-dependent oxidoreductase [Deltaproteobacteria bacterium]
MAHTIETIAVVGGGPAGAMVAALLARAGRRVAIFTKRKRPPLVIGESLVPAIVPFLRELGIEDEVRSYSTFKPGATWVLDPDDVVSFRFEDVRKACTRYSYNSPRDLFDESILKAAVHAGAVCFDHHATVERAGDDRVRLTDDTLAATDGFLRAEPDLIVDASGRPRLLSNLLGIPAVTGGRRDTALFAHLEGVPLIDAGHIHIDRLTRGWAWRIPLPGRVSVGLVVDSDHLRTFGGTAEEQYDAYVAADPVIRRWDASVRRLTPVMKYSNYQVASTRGVGDGWALVGDAFGFIDPIFSSGLLISLDGATVLAHAVLDGSPRALAHYQRHVLNHLASWRRAVGYYYDGRLFTLIKVGQEVRKTWYGNLLDPHFSTHFPRVFTGESTTNRYSLGLLSFMCRHSLGDKDPSQLRVN